MWLFSIGDNGGPAELASKGVLSKATLVRS